MPNHLLDQAVVSETEKLRIALPAWVVSTVDLVELAENANVLPGTSILKQPIGLASSLLKLQNGSRHCTTGRTSR